jgi:hypothetical protein
VKVGVKQGTRDLEGDILAGALQNFKRLKKKENKAKTTIDNLCGPIGLGCSN